MAQTRKHNPPKALISYQRDWLCEPWYNEKGYAVTDTIQKARRVGGSEAAILRGISWALGREVLGDARAKELGQEPGTFIQRDPMNVYVTSKDYPGARGLIAKAIANCQEMAPFDPECEQALKHASATRILFPSTGTIIEAKAPTKSAMRGETGAVIIDEFPIIKQQEDVYAAAKLVANPNLGNEHGYPVLIVGTPWEEGSYAYRVMTEETFGFRQHSVDIYQAKAFDFPIDIEQAFAELGHIQELIDTEYLCKWSRGGSIFFAPAKLRQCLEDELPFRWDHAPVFYGIDVGHGVGRDFTAVIQWRLIGDEYWITGVRAFNDKDIEEQVDAVAPWLRQHPGEVRFDRGMGGTLFGQALTNRLRNTECKIVGAGMTTQDQEKYAKRTRMLLDSHQLKIYTGTDCGGDDEGWRALLLEFAKLKAKMSAGGRLILETPRDPMKGHCDRAWGAMIGLAGTAGRTIIIGGGGNAGIIRRPTPTITEFDDVGIG